MLIALSLASVAWACTSQPRIFALGSHDAPPGSDVRVSGQAVAPQGAVEVRWNGVEGPVLAQATADANGSFSVVARIPEATPGVYTIIAVAGGTGVARSAFEVTSRPASTAQANVVVHAGDFAWRALSSSVASTPQAGIGFSLIAGMGLLAAGIAGLSVVSIALLRRRRPAGTRAG